MARSIFESVTLRPPEKWADASVISFVNPAADNFQANIVVTQHHLDKCTLSEYAQRQSQEFAQEVIDYEVIQNSEHKSDGQTSYTLEHSFLADEPVRIQQLILFVQSDQRVYSVSCTHEAHEFESLRSVFEQTLTSFQIKKGAP